MSTKEILRHQINALARVSDLYALEAANDGALLVALVWHAKIPLCHELRARLMKCPYETGKDVEAIGGELCLLREKIDPHGAISRVMIESISVSREPSPPSDFVEWPPSIAWQNELLAGVRPSSISSITDAVLRVIKDSVPVGIGIDHKEVLRMVAAHVGVAPVPPRIGEMTALVKMVSDDLRALAHPLPGAAWIPRDTIAVAAARLRRAVGLVR